jgi:hypothetical protein
MEFVVDTPGKELYMVKSCLYLGGVSKVDLNSKTTPLIPTVLVKPSGITVKQKGICGERQALGPDPLLVAGRIAQPDLLPNLENSLLFINRNTGEILRSVNTTAAPLDVIVAF